MSAVWRRCCGVNAAYLAARDPLFRSGAEGRFDANVRQRFCFCDVRAEQVLALSTSRQTAGI